LRSHNNPENGQLTGEMQKEIHQEYGEQEDLKMEEDEEISMLEVEIAMGKMIHGKATGEDEIALERIKAGGPSGN
jgi:hypothetical protein